MNASCSLQECVWGIAYEIPTDAVQHTKDHLDHREKGGYGTVSVLFHPQDRSHASFHLDIYIGTQDNPFYLGPADVSEMAMQIHHAVGPSGPNSEYLFQLATAMKELAPEVEDQHLEELERAVRELSGDVDLWHEYAVYPGGVRFSRILRKRSVNRKWVHRNIVFSDITSRAPPTIH